MGDFFSGEYSEFYRCVIVFFSAASPYLELRGAIPLACFWGISSSKAYVLSIIGNILPAFPLMFFMDEIFRFTNRYPRIKKFSDKFFERCEKKKQQIGKYLYWSLFLLVAIPLPMTGVWTASVLASLLKLRKHFALLTIFAGVLVAGAIVLIIFYGLDDILS